MTERTMPDPTPPTKLLPVFLLDPHEDYIGWSPPEELALFGAVYSIDNFDSASLYEGGFTPENSVYLICFMHGRYSCMVVKRKNLEDSKELAEALGIIHLVFADPPTMIMNADDA